MWVNGDWGWGSWVVMTLSMAAFWVMVAVVGLVLLRAWRDGDGRGGGRHASGTNAPGTVDRLTPEQLLAERYARGEIDSAEFDERRRVLRGSELRSGNPGGRSGPPRAAPSRSASPADRSSPADRTSSGRPAGRPPRPLAS
jgi:putative membrane protein